MTHNSVGSEPEPIRLLVIRHAQAEHHGADPPLTELGKRQATFLGRFLATQKLDKIITSTLRRSIETARHMSTVVPCMAEERLCEFKFGSDQPQSYQIAGERSDLELWRPEHGIPGGETLSTFHTRVISYLNELLESSAANSTIALITHAGVIDAAARWAFGLSADHIWATEVEATNVSVTEFAYWHTGRKPGGAPRYVAIRKVADVSHLPPELISLY